MRAALDSQGKEGLSLGPRWGHWARPALGDGGAGLKCEAVSVAPPTGGLIGGGGATRLHLP